MALKVTNDAGNITIDNSGEMTLNGTATRWLDERGYLLASRIESTSSDIEQDLTEGALEYKTTCRITDYVAFNVQLNHDRQHGQVVRPHLHWWQSSATYPNWLIEYRYQKQLAAKTTAWSRLPVSSHAVSYVTGTINQISSFGNITPLSNDGVSDIIQVRLIRDVINSSALFSGSDGLGASVYALDFDIHKPLDAMGSKDEYIK